MDPPRERAVQRALMAKRDRRLLPSCCDGPRLSPGCYRGISSRSFLPLLFCLSQSYGVMTISLRYLSTRSCFLAGTSPSITSAVDWSSADVRGRSGSGPGRVSGFSCNSSGMSFFFHIVRVLIPFRTPRHLVAGDCLTHD